MKKSLYKILILLILIMQLNTISLCDDIDKEIVNVNAEIETSVKNNSKQNKAPDINSRAYVVIDRNTNSVIYGKNENERRKMASTTKIMTATIILENCNLNQTIEVSKKAAGTGGSRLGLKTGDKITIHDLLYGLMLCSGNDCAVALAEYFGGSIDGFSEIMNKKANQLGLKNTNFKTPHGLDADEHYTTAYELAILTNYALNNTTFRNIVSTKNYNITINGSSKNISNTNELLGSLEGVYGVKTGFTNGANRCLVTACKRNNMDIICVVLGADTKKFRTTDSIKLINYAFENFELFNIENLIIEKFEDWKANNLNNIIINKGNYENIDIYLENLDKKIIPIRKDLIDTINVSIYCNNYIEAPLLENTEIGYISVNYDNKNISNYKIYNKNTIKRKDFLFYTVDLFKNFSSLLEKSFNDLYL